MNCALLSYTELVIHTENGNSLGHIATAMEIKSLKWTQIQYNYYPHKKGKFTNIQIQGKYTEEIQVAHL